MISTKESSEVIRLVVVGHVDHGKSSVIGKIMYDLGNINETETKKLSEISKKRGLDFEPAFLLDALQSERDQGITIDTTQIFFRTKKRQCVFIDAPGHKEFIKNMITGAAVSDLALLIVDAFEGVKEQTKKHAYLLKILGIVNVIVLINKMDKVSYCEKHFNNLKHEINYFLKKINISPAFTIPISAKYGDNLTKISSKMKWFAGQTCVNIIDNFKLSKNNTGSPLRFPIQDIYKNKDKRILVGRIETGKMKVGDEVIFLPSRTKVRVASFENWPKAKSEYESGECVGITLEEPIFVDVGNLACNPNEPAQLMQTFEASVFWLSDSPLLEKKKYKFKINTGEYDVTIEKIKKKIDTNNLDSKNNVEYIKKNDVCELVIHSSQLVPMDDYKVNKRTGRFCLLEEGRIVGGGIISVLNFPNQLKKNSHEPKFITPINFSVNEVDRISRYIHRPGIIWLTGLSGSGKSSIAKGVEKRLFNKNFNIFVLDGDNLRLGLNNDLSFSPDDRTENIRRTGEVAKLFSEAGFIVIVSLISPYKSERKKVRDLRPEIFKEVFVKASIEVCAKRDPKGLYLKALRGQIQNFTGLGSPYEEPEKPDLILDTEQLKLEETILLLENFITNQFSITQKKD